MRAILVLLVFAAPGFADPMADARARAALALASAVVPKAAVPKPNLQATSRQAAVNQWLSQPLNVGNCPCAGTGGCHCQPHSLCAGGQCQNHNPLLQGPSSSATNLTAMSPQPQQIQYQSQQYILPQYQSGGCPGGNCPSSGGNERRGFFRRW